MTLLVCGLNHKTAPIQIRERLSLDPAQHYNYIKAACSQSVIQEVAVVSTCNRTELYCKTNDPRKVLNWLQGQHAIKGIDLNDFIYVYRNQQAARHLMRVACGLDSMVLGEPQILGQIKDAYQKACEYGSIGKHLDDLFRMVFQTSKKVRSQTSIGLQPVSVAFTAVNLVRQQFPDLANRKILLIGAGETVELTARYLQKQGANHFWIANRTLENAALVAQQFHGHSITIGEIPQVLPHMDIVISATASQLPIIGKGMIETARRERQKDTLLMMDLAVPRDFEAEIADCSYVSLYNIDDLQSIVQHNLDGRRDAAKQAEQILEVELDKFIRTQRASKAVGAIRRYRHTMTKLAEQETERALAALDRGADPRTIIEELGRRLVNKSMHIPSIKLREAGHSGRADLLKLTEYLFESDIIA